MYLYLRTQSFANNNPSLWVNTYTSRALELATPLPLAAKLEYKSSLRVEDLYAMVMAVSDDNSVFIIDCNTKDPIELADICSFSTKSDKVLGSTRDVHFEWTSLDVLVTHRDGNLYGSRKRDYNE